MLVKILLCVVILTTPFEGPAYKPNAQVDAAPGSGRERVEEACKGASGASAAAIAARDEALKAIVAGDALQIADANYIESIKIYIEADEALKAAEDAYMAAKATGDPTAISKALKDLIAARAKLNRAFTNFNAAQAIYDKAKAAADLLPVAQAYATIDSLEAAVVAAEAAAKKTGGSICVGVLSPGTPEDHGEPRFDDCETVADRNKWWCENRWLPVEDRTKPKIVIVGVGACADYYVEKVEENIKWNQKNDKVKGRPIPLKRCRDRKSP